MKLGPLVISRSGIGLVWGERKHSAPARPFMRGYDAAKLDRYSNSFRVGSGARFADDILWAKAPTLRRVSRHLERNDRTAKTILRRRMLRFGGDTGPIPRFPRGRGMQERWKQYARRCNTSKDKSWGALIKQWAKESATVGDGLLEMVLQGGELLLRPHECEELSSSGFLVGDTDSTVVRDGVRYDVASGRKLAWVFELYNRSLLGGSAMSAIVEVPSERILHLYTSTRPSASRGESLFAQAAIALHDRSDTTMAQLLLQKAAAYLGASITTESPSTDLLDALGTEDDPDSSGELSALQQLVTMDPGAISFLPKGTQMSVLSAKTPDPECQALYKTLTMELAALADVSASEISGDFTARNFSNTRMEEISNEFGTWDVRVEAEETLYPFVEEWIRVEGMAGRIKAAPSEAAKLALETTWSWPAKPIYDLAVELDAINTEIATGTKTWSQACEERGLDPEEQAAAILADEKLAKKYDIILPGTRTPILKPGGVSAAGAEAAAEALGAESSDDDERETA